MDVLSDILGALNLRGSLYFTTEFGPPWGVRVPRLRRVARFHLVTRGACWVSVEGDSEPTQLEGGDVVLIPHGSEHVLCDHPDSPILGVDEVVERAGWNGRGTLVFGGEDRGHPTRLLCGHFEFDEGAVHPFLQRIPRRIVIRHEEMERHGLDELFRVIAREAQASQPGSDAVVKRLSEILLIQVVRAWAALSGSGTGMMAALADPNVGESLAALHADPGKGWTLEALAREAGLSRSVFASRFQKLMALTPMQYVACWRVQQACRLLQAEGATIETIAARVGYESTAAFSRVFKKWAGESPGRYRRKLRTNGAGS